MSDITIITNHHYREVGHSTPEWSDEEESCFNYKGHTYYLSEFMRTDGAFEGYDGYLSETYFSGVLIKLSDCGDGLKVARYYN